MIFFESHARYSHDCINFDSCFSFFSSICPGSSYELRWFSLLPKSRWDNKYYTPIGDSHDDQDYSFVRAFIYNPGVTGITVRWRKGGPQSGSCVEPSSPNDHEYCSGTKLIGQKSTGSIELYDYDNTMTGYEFYTDSATDDFFGVVVVDTRSNWQAFDWGHSLIPESQLSSQIIIGDGRRCDGEDQTTANCDNYGINYVWITPVANAKIWVSYSGETPTSVANDFPALSTFRFGGVDRDLSGAYIFATEPDGQPDGPPVDFAAVWGQEPYESSLGSTAQSLQLDMVSEEEKRANFGKTPTLSTTINLPSECHLCHFCKSLPITGHLAKGSRYPPSVKNLRPR